MKLYGGKYIRNRMNEVSENHRETWDAILWDVDMTKRTCRVKIQGSDNLITARFPSNWADVPHWMKVGNAVRIVHRGGIRGKIELVSDGQVVPTAIVGGSQTPPGEDGGDGVLSGCQVIAIP